MILRELITILAFKADDKVLKAYDAKIVALKKNLFLVTAAAAAVSVAIFGIADSAAKAGDELDKTKDLTGLTVEQLQKLTGAAKLAGVEVEGLRTGMQLFGRQISQAAQGQQMSIRAFQMLGINIFDANGKLKDNHRLLLETADAFSKLHNQQVKVDLAMQLFGRSGGRMINLLKKGSAGVKEAEAEFSKFGFTMTDVQSKAAAQFEDRMTMVGFAVKGLKNAIGIELLPEVSRMVNMFLKWFAANKKIITQGLVNLFKDLGMFVKIVANVFGAMLSTVSQFVNIFGGWNRVLKVTTLLLGLLVSTKIIRGFAALGKAVVLLAFNFKKLAEVEALSDALLLIWPAIAAAIFLAADDVKTFIEGGTSLIGKFIKKSSALGMVITGIGKTIAFVFTAAKDVIVFGLIDPLKIVWGLLKDIASLAGKAFKIAGDIRHPIKALESAFAPAKAVTAATATGKSAVQTAAANIAAPIAKTAALGAVSKSITNHINTNVNLQVPEGTPDQQKGFLQQTAEKVFDKMMDSHFKAALTRFPLME